MISRRCLLPVAALGLRGASNEEALFDGATWRGWRTVAGRRDFPSHCWTVENGCAKALVARGVFEDIRTEEEFGDFELAFEWRIAPGGNAGVKYLIHREDRWQPKGAEGYHARGRGFEYQLADDTAMTGGEQRAGAMYGFQAPARTDVARRVGEFNEARIVRRGAYVEHWLNGVRVIAVDLASGAMQARMRERKVPAELPGRSPIVLQNHASEAWIRRMVIRRLD